MHIDTSHLYEHVVEDIVAARTLLKPGGFDDTEPWGDVLTEWLDRRSYWRYEEQQVAGDRVLRVQRPAPRPRPVEEPEPEPEPRHWWQRR